MTVPRSGVCIAGKENTMTTKVGTKNNATTKPVEKAEPDPEEVVKSWQDEDRENLEILEFIQAVDRFKRRTQKAFPSWSEVLKILKDLGYRKSYD